MTKSDQTAAVDTTGAADTRGDPVADIAAELPYLRRYARALTGNQDSGDRYAVATLEAILADSSILDGKAGARVGLFRAFHSVWNSSGSLLSGPGADPSAAERKAQARLSALTPQSREALLLRTIEEFRIAEIAQIMDVTEDEAEELVATALREMEADVVGKVMVIEDEPLIAMDIRNIVEDMGHFVTGVARTQTEALALGDKDMPDLILADIQLADNSSGIDAVNDLLERLGQMPVVFITAFPPAAAADR